MGSTILKNDGTEIRIAESPDIVRRALGIMETPEGDGEVRMSIPIPRRP
jgi:hypothetical protein